MNGKIVVVEAALVVGGSAVSSDECLSLTKFAVVDDGSVFRNDNAT